MDLNPSDWNRAVELFGLVTREGSYRIFFQTPRLYYSREEIVLMTLNSIQKRTQVYFPPVRILARSF